MKAVVKTEPKAGAHWLDVDVPRVGPGEVLAQVRVAAICGSDISLYKWAPSVARSGLKLPRIMGHEFCGTVVEIGSNVTTVQLGDRIAAETHIPCGHCYQCTTDHRHICENLRILGRHTDGCFAEYVLLPEICARKVPLEIPDDVASILEPLGFAVRAATTVEVQDRNVAVLGCGPIGLFVVAALKALGAKSILATELSPYRLDLVRSMGAVGVSPAETDASEVLLDYTQGRGVDIAIEASGNAASVEIGFQSLRKGGIMIMLGIPGDRVAFDVASWIVRKEATVLGLHGREMFATWDKVESMLIARRLNVEPLLTHRLPLRDFERAFSLCKSGTCGKVLLTLQTG